MPDIEGRGPQPSPNHRWRAAGISAVKSGQVGGIVPPDEHRGPKIGFIRRGKDHWRQVVLGRAGHRVGVGLIQRDHGVCEGKQEGDGMVGYEGASPIVVGRYGDRRIATARDRVDTEHEFPWKYEYVSTGTGGTSTGFLRGKAVKSVR